jgi:subtilisin family serine protease
MKKLILNILILLCLAGNVLSSERYYYYKNQKIYLPIIEDKVFFQCLPNEIGVQLLLEQNALNSTRKRFAGNNMYIAATMNGFNLESFKSNINIRYASYMLKYKNYNVAITNKLTLRVKPEYINTFVELYHESGLSILDTNKNYPNYFTLIVPKESSKDALDWANYFYETGYFIFSEPDFFVNEVFTSGDPEFGNQWGLKNTGQNGGTVGADINVEEAWELTKGRDDIVVAVLDMGIDLDHPDLAGNLVEGFDVTGSSTDSHGDVDNNEPSAFHGTSCAGIIAAVDNNDIGISGVAPNSKLMPIRIAVNGVGFTESAIADGIDIAVEEGADILSCSFSGGIPLSDVDNSIESAVINGRNGLGTIIVFSSGNDSRNNVGDITTDIDWPSNNENVITVGAMSSCNERMTWKFEGSTASCDEEGWLSRFGPELDVMAPGAKMITLDNVGTAGENPSDLFSEFNGTSAACPHVAGIMALILSINRCLTVSDARKILESSCDKVGPYCYFHHSNQPFGMWNAEMGYGRVNAGKAVRLANSSDIFTFSSLTHSSDEISSQQTIQFNLGCFTSTGISLAKKHKLTKQITYNHILNPTIIASSNGFSGASPNDGFNYVGVTDIDNTNAILKTFVYEVVDLGGSHLAWIPCSPSNVRFHATVFSEFENDLLFQNQNMLMTKEFNVLNQIKAGNHVNTSITFGDLIIKSTANITFRAGEEILLEEGFETEDNSEFLAIIEKQFTCTQFPLGKKSNRNNRKNTLGKKNDNLLKLESKIISIFPNPTNNNVFMEGTIFNENSVEINLTDIYGKILLTESILSNDSRLIINKSMSLTNYSTGIYFIQIKMGKEIETFKIIKF